MRNQAFRTSSRLACCSRFAGHWSKFPVALGRIRFCEPGGPTLGDGAVDWSADFLGSFFHRVHLRMPHRRLEVTFVEVNSVFIPDLSHAAVEQNLHRLSHSVRVQPCR
jgi:hypothetical protein